MHFRFSVLIDISKRVDIYLSTLFSDFSRSYIQKLIDSGQVAVNNEIINKNIKIKNRDEIKIYIKKESTDLSPENLNLNIIYEDENILVINKDYGINVHPITNSLSRTGTIVNGVLYHCRNRLPLINGVERPGIVHRLDKDTSGVMMIAKTDKMMNHLSNIIKNREIKKYYIAIVLGKMKNEKFSIKSYIGRDPNSRQHMTVNNPINPKEALSYGEVLGYIDDKYTLLKIRIETGRTHQIRVHMSSIGFSIIGDKIYGNKTINKEVSENYGLKRQALHASDLYLKLYNKDFHFKAEFKEDMSKLISKSHLPY